MADPLERLLSARLNAALGELHAYVPSTVTASVRLDANEAPPLLPSLSEEERAIYRAALGSVEPARYPDVRATMVRAPLAAQLGVAPERLVIGCGSDELIALLLSTLGRPVDGEPPVALVPCPTFVMYRMAARIHGYRVVPVPLDARFDLDEAAMLEAIGRHRPAVVFLATPNNPTAGCYSLPRVKRLVEAAARCDPPSLVVIDEAYLPFRLGPGDPWGGVTGLDLQLGAPHVLVLRTFSKVGLAALRVGYAIGHPELAAAIDKVRPPYDLPTTSQAGAAAALGPLAPSLARHVAAIRAERARLVAELSRVPGAVFERPDANFVWFSTPRPAQDVWKGLVERGVLVRAFVTDPHHLRVTVGTPSEDDRFLEALDSVLG